VRTDWPFSRAVALAALFVLTAFAAPGQALAKSPPKPPPDTSAIDQYIEVIPTGGGGVALGVGDAQSTAVSKRIGKLLSTQGGKDAAALRAVVSSSVYGAPQHRLHQTSKSKKQQSTKTKATKATSESHPAAATPASPNVLSAAVSASGGSGSHAFWLLGILVVTTVAALVTAALRQRARRF
jgi:hypothetical protein